jgi:peptidoglycan/xylan/chitin deacetylase (PgdA/CDA1 family)
MSRCAVTTLLSVAGIVAAAIFLDGRIRTAAIASIVVAYIGIFAFGIASIRMQFFGPALCRAAPGRMRIALTFDDGPDPLATPALLELLRHEKVPATFFCIGKHVAAHPQLAAQIAADGHLIGNHTYRHLWWTSFLLGRPLMDELTRTQQAIEQATGTVPKYMRPPIGLTNPHFPSALRKAKLSMVGWDIRPYDTSRPAVAVIKDVLKRARDGSIILLHDGGAPPEKIVLMVSTIIGDLRARGFWFERIDRM